MGVVILKHSYLVFSARFSKFVPYKCVVCRYYDHVMPLCSTSLCWSHESKITRRPVTQGNKTCTNGTYCNVQNTGWEFLSEWHIVMGDRKTNNAVANSNVSAYIFRTLGCHQWGAMVTNEIIWHIQTHQCLARIIQSNRLIDPIELSHF
jgi:hypothetical protein